MKIVIATDAWLPQTNGVVNSLSTTGKWLTRFGHEVTFLTPQDFRTVPCPTYPEVRLAWRPGRSIAERLRSLDPDAVHIATEGPIGIATRSAVLREGLRFTTSYHTQFPQYLRQRAPVPLALSYGLLRRFHAAAARTMVSTPTVESQLAARGFTRLVRWSRGVDTELFRPRNRGFLDLPRPIAVYVGRVAVEKNIEAFLSMEWAGTRLVVGDGPAREALQRRYPSAVFVGYRHGEDLARHIAAADVMVFPSRTDTFGLVNLEAMACGVPVAAFPVPGPIDVIDDGITGFLDEDLARAARKALRLDPADCRAAALRRDWETSTRQFERNLVAA